MLRAGAPSVGAERFCQVAWAGAAIPEPGDRAIATVSPMTSPPSDRSELRRTLRAWRRSLPDGIAHADAIAVAARALALLADLGLLDDAETRVVGATVADDGELDPAPLLDALTGRGARIAYARVEDATMGFAGVASRNGLVAGPGGVLQPPSDAPAVGLAELDLVLVPLVAFDQRCNRIGRGAGHFDRTFAERGPAPLLVGLAHDEQRVADCSPLWHDVALDFVVTPSTVVSRLGS